MKLRIIKETKDLRENRPKILKVGTVMTVTDELGEKYLSAKLAEKVIDGGIRPIKNVKEALKYEQEQKDKN